jgi:hypothetical protein
MWLPNAVETWHKQGCGGAANAFATPNLSRRWSVRMAAANLIAFPATSKRCAKCVATKPLSEFYVHAKSRDGLQSYCKVCQKAINAANHIKRDRTPRQMRAAHLHQRFRMTEEDYSKLLANQRGGCAVCARKDNRGRRLAIDHNHTTGAVRGLLCFGCNRVLGAIEKFPHRFMKYLRYPPARRLGIWVLVSPSRKPKCGTRP